MKSYRVSNLVGYCIGPVWNLINGILEGTFAFIPPLFSLLLTFPPLLPLFLHSFPSYYSPSSYSIPFSSSWKMDSPATQLHPSLSLSLFFFFSSSSVLTAASTWWIAPRPALKYQSHATTTTTHPHHHYMHPQPHIHHVSHTRHSLFLPSLHLLRISFTSTQHPFTSTSHHSHTRHTTLNLFLQSHLVHMHCIRPHSWNCMVH